MTTPAPARDTVGVALHQARATLEDAGLRHRCRQPGNSEQASDKTDEELAAEEAARAAKETAAAEAARNERAHPGYRSKLDPDGDGIACEN